MSQAQKICSKAADLIAIKGMCPYRQIDKDGRLCIHGAFRYAVADVTGNDTDTADCCPPDAMASVWVVLKKRGITEQTFPKGTEWGGRGGITPGDFSHWANQLAWDDDQNHTTVGRDEVISVLREAATLP